MNNSLRSRSFRAPYGRNRAKGNDFRTRENWRTQRAADQVFTSREASGPPLRGNNNNSVVTTRTEANRYDARDATGSYAPTDSQNSNGNTGPDVQALHSSEFIADLCWDVEGVEEDKESTVEVRAISPRMQAVIFGKRVM